MTDVVLIFDEFTHLADRDGMLVRYPDCHVLARGSVSAASKGELFLTTKGRWHRLESFRTAETSQSLYSDTLTTITDLFAAKVGDKSGQTLEEALMVDGLSLRRVLHNALSHIVGRCLSDAFTISLALESLRPKKVVVASGTTQLEAVAIEEAQRRSIDLLVMFPLTKKLPGRWRYRGGSAISAVPTALDRWRNRKLLRQLEERWAAFRVDAEDQAAFDKKDILFPLHYRTDVKAVAPVVEHLLQKSGILKLSLTADLDGLAAQTLLSDATGYAEMTALVTSKDIHWVHEQAARCGAVWKRSLRRFATGNTAGQIAVKAALAEIEALGETGINELSIIRAIWWYRLMKKTVQATSARLMVITDEATPFYQAALQAAKSEGIKVLDVPHGAFAVHPKCLDHRSDLIAVAGNSDRLWLEKLGTKSERIVITGRPSLDPLSGDFSERGESVRKSLGLLGDIRPLLVFTPVSGRAVTPMDEVAVAVREVLVSAKNRPDFRLVIKPHPIDDGILISELAKEEGPDDVLIVKDVDLHGLFFEAAVVATMSSTTGLEAIMLDRPLIVVNLSGKPDTISYAADGAAIGVYQVGSMIEVLDDVMFDDETKKALAAGREQFISSHAFRNDGRSTQRVVDSIEGLLAD